MSTSEVLTSDTLVENAHACPPSELCQGKELFDKYLNY